jgi:hypothetical protein
LNAAIAAALDGGKKAIAARKHQKEIVIKSLRINCAGRPSDRAERSEIGPRCR